MKAVGNNILVEMVTSEVLSLLHTPVGVTKENKIETTYKVLGFGESCENIDKLNKGESLIFGEYFKPLGGKEVSTEEITKDGKKLKIITQHIIVHYDAVVALV